MKATVITLHIRGMKDNFPIQILKNGSLRLLLPRNAVTTESYLPVWKIIKACKTASHSKFAKFNLQSDVPCIRRFDPG